MVAQLPRGHPELNELRAVAAELMLRLDDLRERAIPAPEAWWRVAERLQPLLDGVEPGPEEVEELWELALDLPRARQALLVRDGVEDVEPGGA
ncbi:hypothetical protein [Streptacidiphilus rugosus]|uniref:hypothetical protein n=1 Tax=Streptacidiphilus rugosus TaxID=405783 RepID=UPI0005630A29|nr:hypothetical protein [Streptacidiphilus rugosus]